MFYSDEKEQFVPYNGLGDFGLNGYYGQPSTSTSSTLNPDSLLGGKKGKKRKTAKKYQDDYCRTMCNPIKKGKKAKKGKSKKSKKSKKSRK